MNSQIRHSNIIILLATVAVAAVTMPAARADQQLTYTVNSHNERVMKSASEQEAAKKSPDSKDKETPLEEDKHFTKTITLGDNYVRVEEDGQKSIFNFTDKFVYLISDKDKHYTKIDLHALLNFRIMEYMNREMLSQVLKSANVPLTFGDRFAMESLFSINDPNGKTKLQLNKRLMVIPQNFSTMAPREHPILRRKTLSNLNIRRAGPAP